jgi:hypothetical protein
MTRTRNTQRMRFSILPLVLLGACAYASTPWTGIELGPVENAPAAFVTVDNQPVLRGCRSPLLDPRDQTRIQLVRSARVEDRELGDYDVSGRYGVGPRELLRIDCSTGAPLGIVPGE